MNQIESFATLVREAYENQDQDQFSQLISIDVNNQIVSRLVQELGHVNKSFEKKKTIESPPPSLLKAFLFRSMKVK